jgi:hypothetical protein
MKIGDTFNLERCCSQRHLLKRKDLDEMLSKVAEKAKQ